MHTVRIENLTGNEILAKHIVSSSENILISKGTILKKEYIERLKELNIESVVVQDAFKEDLSAETQLLKTELYNNTKEVVKNSLEQHIYKHTRELSKLCEIAEEVIQGIMEDEDILNHVIEIHHDSADVYSHSVSVCSLATVLALKLGFNKKSIDEIAKGALLHDIGLRAVDVDYVNKELSEMLHPDEVEVKKHVIYGYESLKDAVWLPDLSKKIILHHHEASDGTGFPFKIKSNRTADEIKVVAVCDAYDRMISGMGCKQTTSFHAIEFLKFNIGRKFDKWIAETLVNIMALYPIGTRVKTNEGEIGYVVRQNRDFTDRPIIMITEDSQGKPLDVPHEIDLLKTLNLYIQEVCQ